MDADEGQLSQAFNNILINARQAMPAGGEITVSASNRALDVNNIQRLAEGPYIEISITDQGTGIPEKILPRIFDPFFTTKQRDSGLGLATSYSIIVKHGGHISAESTMGSGTTVTILLPSVEREEGASLSSGAGLKKGSGKILLMDDEELVREVASRMLTRLEYEVVTAEKGEDASSRGARFDAVILDLTVTGGMGGEKTLEKLLAMDENVRAVASSGYSDSPVLAHFRDYGFVGVIAKPYRMRDLGLVLSDVFRPARRKAGPSGGLEA